MRRVLLDGKVRLERAARNLTHLAHSYRHVLRERDALAGELLQLRRDTRRSRTVLRKGNAAVVSWDLGHNPAGRAQVLSDLLSDEWAVDVIGPIWPRYGSRLWDPLRGNGGALKGFQVADFRDFFARAITEAARIKYDLVCVSKPRLPSLLLGFLIKEHSDCPLLLDIDDHELSFFANRSPATLEELIAGGLAALREPYEELATRYSEDFISNADAVTISNVALRSK